MTWLELIHTIDPTVPSDLAEELLWNETCFPFGGPAMVYPQLSQAIRAHRHGHVLSEMCGCNVKFPCRHCREYAAPERNDRDLETA